MRKLRRYFFFLCVLICAFILTSGQAVYATRTHANQVQTTQVSSTSASLSTSDWDSVKECIKLVGGSLFGIITALIGIHKFFLEKDYDIKEIEIELVNENKPQNIKYTDFICGKIFKKDRVIKQLDTPNPYYLDLIIKISTPNGRKTLNNIVIRKLVLNMNGYVLICKPKNGAVFNSPKCPFNKQEGKETCEILLKWPTIVKDDRAALNPTKAFRDPVDFNVYISWFPSVILVSIGGFIFPQKREIEFEKIKHENGSPRIIIKSKGIFKGKRKKENEYNNL